METVQLIRDISIIVFVATAFVAMTLVTVMALKLYRKVSPVLEDAQTTARNAARISSVLASGVSNPMTAIIAAVGAAGGAAFAAIRRKQKKQAEG